MQIGKMDMDTHVYFEDPVSLSVGNMAKNVEI